MPRFTADLHGLRFERLTVLERAHIKGHDALWKCRCVCGAIVIATSNKLRSGHTKSCGCLTRDRLIEMHLTHGRTGTREHRQWKGAKSRCYNPNNPKYSSYGGRGISMHPRWREDFAKFYADMGPCPSLHSLDRIDNERNYEPGNCRWASPRQQANNTRQNVKYTYRGETHTIAEWAPIVGLTYAALVQRLRSHGWSLERAMNKPQIRRQRH